MWEQVADLAGDDEADLLADVDRLVAQPLQEAGHEDGLEGPPERLRAGGPLDLGEDLVVEAVDRLVEGRELLGGVGIAVGEAGPGRPSPPP